ncbi:PKD domain-containing protein [Flammeovirga sp. OC4]|uniref:Ig-like domain-containing protein n=1 Tax=Flammeovirga sp. OC4 TaxID=1382345 RepID=UPI0012E047C4|nr:PKD domain-containing protein [Flammeovirga sp. OC4]
MADTIKLHTMDKFSIRFLIIALYMSVSVFTASTINAQTLDHSNDVYFNNTDDKSWTLLDDADDNITAPPTASDFYLITKLGADGSVVYEGSSMISITEVSANEEYTITIDFSQVSSQSNNDEYILYYVNESGTTITASSTYILDNEAPAVPVITPQAASITGRTDLDSDPDIYYTKEAEVVFDFTNIEENCKIELFEGGSNSEGTIDPAVGTGDNLTGSDLSSDGVYSYHIVVTDRAGNTNTSNTIEIGYTTSSTLVVDFDAIDLSINNNLSSAPDNVTNNPDVELKFDGFTVISPLPQELIIQNSSDEELASFTIDENSETITLPTLTDGSHTITYFIRDEYGNDTAEESFTFTVDTKAPSILSSSIATGYSANNQLAVKSDDEPTADDATITIETNEALSSTSTVTINNVAAINFNDLSSNNYDATQADLSISSYAAVPIEINLVDIAGNTATITTTTDGSEIYTFPEIVNTITTSDQLVFCEESSPVAFVKDDDLSGGDGNYTISWERNTDDAGYSAIGVNSEGYTENATLSAGTYKYRRVITSRGVDFPSNVLEIEVESNTITNNTIGTTTDVFVGTSISANAIQITEQVATSYSFEWEYSTDGESWSTIGSENDKDLTYNQEITSVGSHYFRRKAIDGACSAYSNEVIINLYASIENDIQNDGNSVFCEGNQTIELSSQTTVTGGDASYVFDWLRKDDGVSSFSSLGITTENLTENVSLSPGTYTYKRTVESAGVTEESDEIEITIYSEIADNTLDEGAIKTKYNGEISANTISFSPGSATGGDGSLTYQWQFNTGSSWSNAGTDPNYTYNATVSEGTEVKFRRIVNDASGDCESISNEITIVALPEIENTIAIVGDGKYCETFSSFEINNDNVAGGDDQYTYKWYREKTGSGVNEELTGQTNPNYIELDALTDGEYTYTRTVTSAGNTTTSNSIVVTIEAILENEIEKSGTLVYFDEIPNTFEINNKTLSGGDNSYTYVWEIKYESNAWEVTTVTTQDFESYSEKIETAGIYKFRRKVISGKCGESYSNEITINLYDPIVNDIENIGNSVFCDGNQTVELSSEKAVSGGDGSYVYDWLRKTGTGPGGFTSIGIDTENLTDNAILSQGTYSYKRKVTSALKTVESNPIVITVYSEISDNTIDEPSKTKYNGEVSANVISFTPGNASGGDNNLTYQWQYNTGSSWEDAGTDPDYTYDKVIGEDSEVKFRRIVNDASGDCESISNEITIVALPEIENTIAIAGDVRYCETFSSFEINNDNVAGGDDQYDYQWYREKTGSGVNEELSGQTNSNYIEVGALTSGEYTYTRTVTSAGNTVTSNSIVITIDAVLENEIKKPTTDVYYDEIPNSLVIENKKLKGGDTDNTLVWEIQYESEGWVETTITTTKFENYTKALDKAGEYKFRRKVVSEACGELYSNEVSITLYALISSSTIKLESAAETCIGDQVFISGSIPNGGTGSYEYSWYKRNNDVTTTFTLTSVKTPFYFEDDIADAGDFTYKRVVSSKDIDDTALNNVVDVFVNAAPTGLVLSPLDGSSYSNGPQVNVTLDISDVTEFYCTGKGVVSNGEGPDHNIFYPSLAGIGDHVITYHITVGACVYTQTSTIRVYDGSQPFAEVSSEICETSADILIDMTDDAKVNVPDELIDNYIFKGAVLINDDGNEIVDYGTNTSFTFAAGDGLESDDVGTSKLITLKAVYGHKDDITQEKELTQEILLTFEPSLPNIEGGTTFNYCFEGENIKKLKTVDAIGLIEWREEEGGTVIGTGFEFDPPIKKEIDEDVTKTFYVTQSINGCSSETVEVTINSYKKTDRPTLVNAGPFDICEGDPMPTFEIASGDNVKWYDDKGNVLGEGVTFTSGFETTGIDDEEEVEFFITSTVNECESMPEKVTVKINPKPSIPEIEGDVYDYCAGSKGLDDITVRSESKASFTWYTNSELTVEATGANGRDLKLPDAPDAVDGTQTFSYWVVKTIDGCDSDPLKVSYDIYENPPVPSLVDNIDVFDVCAWDDPENIQTINAVGTVYWYEDKPETVGYDQDIWDGEDFTPDYDTEVNSDVSYTYYIAQMNDNGCFSPSKKVTVNVNALPDIPTIPAEYENLEVCSGDNLPTMKVTGQNVKWYASDDMDNAAFEGDTYTPDLSYNVVEDSLVYYYVTSTSGKGCEGDFEVVSVEIKALPDAPELVEFEIPSYCIGDKIKDITVFGESGATFEWFTSETMELETKVDLEGDNAILKVEDAAPSVTELDSVHYWVTQTTPLGCTSLPLKVSIPVYPTPKSPTLSSTDIYYCYDDNGVPLQATGEFGNITWYLESGFEIPPRFITPDNRLLPILSEFKSEEKDKTITFYVTDQNEIGCESEPTAVNITIYQKVPLVGEELPEEINYCAGETIQPIVLTEGENLQWYADEDLSEKLADGLIFIPNISTDVTEDFSVEYYVTQTINGCEGEPQEVEIEVYSLPEAPVVELDDALLCVGDRLETMEAEGVEEATFTWYTNESLTNKVGDQSTFDPDSLAPNVDEITTLDFWVTQTTPENCTSEAAKVSFTVYPIPSKPGIESTHYEYCYGVPVEELVVTGNMVTWYEDEELTENVRSGNTFRPPFIPNESTSNTVLTYYVTQKNEIGCEGVAEEVTITLYKETIAPKLTQNTFEYCSGAVLQPITVEGGVNIRWYSDSALENEVGTGNTFTPQDDTDVTEDITVNYFYTETLNGCESNYETVSVIVYNTPTAPSIVGNNEINYCSGDVLQPILVLGQSDNLRWYADEEQKELLSTESEFTPTINNVTTSVLTEDYYVTYTKNNCESPVTKITVTVNPLPVISLLGITEGEVLCKTDDNPIIQAFPSNGTLTSSTGAVIRNNEEILLANSPLGEHTLNYTVTNENNCVESLTLKFTIVDVPEVKFTETVICDSKEVTFNDETFIAEDDNLTEILEWRYNFGDNEGSIVLYTEEAAREYTHTYKERGSHDVTLTVITNQNCSEISYEKSIFINSPPSVEFDWYVSEFGSEMVFEEHLEIYNDDIIVTRLWDFGDGTTSTEIDPKHQYSSVGTYTVTYEVVTEKGCSNLLEKEVYVLPHPVLLSDEDAYFQNFDIDDGDWKATSNDTNISWEYGIPTTPNFSSANNAWVTNLDSTYFENEESFLNLPSFDISGLSKPMLSFDMKIDIEEGIDGAILQYSLDSGQTWFLLGDISDPINWYNSQSILADPGNQIFGTNTLSKGWTGDNSTFGQDNAEYISVRHHLDNFIGEEHLRLRFAFKSNSAQEYEGLVIDNFFVGNRNKVVLIESMTNAGQEASNRSMSALGEHLATMESDVLSVNYHINLEGFIDQLNKDNLEASSGRKFFYGITNAPRTIVDGNTFQDHTDEFLKNFENYVYGRTLLDPEFSIDLDLDDLNSSGKIGVTLTSHGTFDASNSEILLHVVMIEKSITGIEMTDDISAHLNVMKSMSPAPGAEGTSFFGRSWSKGSSEKVYVNWANRSVYSTNAVELILFVQDNTSKEIFQAMSYQLDPNLLTTGIVNDIELAEDLEWNIYPNPASSLIQVSTTEFIQRGNWEISNINGQKVKEGAFSGNRYSVNVDDLASGVYLIRNLSDGKYLPKTLRFVVSK